MKPRETRTEAELINPPKSIPLFPLICIILLFRSKHVARDNNLIYNSKYQFLVHLTANNCPWTPVLSRIECGWPGITKEECLARKCCYDNNTAYNYTQCFVQSHLGK